MRWARMPIFKKKHDDSHFSVIIIRALQDTATTCPTNPSSAIHRVTEQLGFTLILYLEEHYMSAE